MACHFSSETEAARAQAMRETEPSPQEAKEESNPAAAMDDVVLETDTKEEPKAAAAMDAAVLETDTKAPPQALTYTECSTEHFVDVKVGVAVATFVILVVFLSTVIPYYSCTSWRCWGGFFTLRRSLCTAVPIGWLVASITYSPHRPKLCVVAFVGWSLSTTHSLITGKPYNLIFYVAGLMVTQIFFVVLPGAFTGNRKGLCLSLDLLGLFAQPALLTGVQRLNAISSALPPSLAIVKPVLLPILKTVYAAANFGLGQFLANRYYKKPTSMIPPVAFFSMIVTSLEAASLATCLAIPVLYKDSKGELWFQLILFLVSNGIAELSSRRAVPQGTLNFFKAKCQRGWQFRPLEDSVRRLKLQVSYYAWPWCVGVMLAVVVSHAGDSGNEAVQWMGLWEVYMAAALYFAHQVIVDIAYIKLLRLPGKTLKENWSLAREPGRACPFLGQDATQQAVAEQKEAVEPEDTKVYEFPLGCYRVPMPVMAILAAICTGGSIFDGTLTGLLGTCAMGLPPSLCPE